MGRSGTTTLPSIPIVSFLFFFHIPCPPHLKLFTWGLIKPLTVTVGVTRMNVEHSHKSIKLSPNLLLLLLLPQPRLCIHHLHPLFISLSSHSLQPLQVCYEGGYDCMTSIAEALKVVNKGGATLVSEGVTIDTNDISRVQVPLPHFTSLPFTSLHPSICHPFPFLSISFHLTQCVIR